MEKFVPDGITWLSEDEKYLNGIEIGAILMLCHLSTTPLIKAKVRAWNEDQLRVAAPAVGYHFNVDTRDEDWCYVTLSIRTPVEGAGDA